MKKQLIIILVIIIIAVSSLPALAKGMEFPTCNTPPTQVNKRYALAGWIKEIDVDEELVTVLVAAGNMLVKDCIENEEVVVISVVTDTTLKISGGIPIDFDDLKKDDPVSSIGHIKYVDGEVVWEAIQITKGALLLSK